MRLTSLRRLYLGLMLAAACAPINSTQLPTPMALGEPTQPIQSPQLASTPPTGAPTAHHTRIVEFSDAESVAVVSGAGSVFFTALGKEHSLFVVRSTDGGQTWDQEVLATGNHIAHALTIERPALAANANGHLGLAWLELPSDYNGGQVWYVASNDSDQTFSPGQLVATDASGETTMVTLVLDELGNPILTWLNGSRLRFARSFDQGRTFTAAQDLGNGSCECCQPYSVIHDEQIYVAYRSLEPAGAQGDIRDIVLVRSEDAGQTFESVTRVSDTHWYLQACPIAGPSLALTADKLLVTWMDGRYAPTGTFERGDVWLAWSQNGGQNFSPNVRLNVEDGLYHTKPFIEVGWDGQVHLVWEAQGNNNGGLQYTHSVEGSLAFASPTLIVDSLDATKGRPRMPMLSANASSQILLAWIDRRGANLTRLDTLP